MERHTALGVSGWRRDASDVRHARATFKGRPSFFDPSIFEVLWNLVNDDESREGAVKG